MEKLLFRYAAALQECTDSALLAQREFSEKGMKPYLTSGRHIGALQLMDEADLKEYGAVIVDEAHAVNRAQAEFLVHIAHGLGIPVLCFGIRCGEKTGGAQFALGAPFEGAMLLMAWADEVAAACLQEASFEGTEDDRAEMGINPLLLEFMDAKTFAEKLDIFNRLKFAADNDMVNTIAVVLDIEVREGDLEKRLLEVEKCLETFVRFECDRLR